MEDDRREALGTRREQARIEQARIEQARSRARERIADFLDGIPGDTNAYELIWLNHPEAAGLDASLRRYPLGRREGWAGLPGFEQTTWSDSAGAAAAARSLMERRAPDRGLVVAAWNDAALPLVRLGLADLMAAAEPWADASWDAVALGPAGAWCIECHHEGDLFYAETKG